MAFGFATLTCLMGFLLLGIDFLLILKILQNTHLLRESNVCNSLGLIVGGISTLFIYKKNSIGIFTCAICLAFIAGTMLPDSFRGYLSPHIAICFFSTATFLFIELLPSQSSQLEKIKIPLSEFILLFIITLSLFSSADEMMHLSSFSHPWGNESHMGYFATIGCITIGLGLIYAGHTTKDMANANMPLWSTLWLCLLIITFDLTTPLETAAGIAYLPIVFCSLWFKPPRMAFVLAALASTLTTIGFFLFPHAETMGNVLIFNRGLTVGVLWCVAILIYLSRTSNFEHRKIEQRLQALVNTTVNVIITFYPNGRIESYNPATLRMFGYEPSELENLNIQNLLPELYNSLPKQKFPNITDSKENEELKSTFIIRKEAQAIRKDKNILPVHFSVVGIQSDEQTLYTTIVTDITDPKRSKLLLRQFGEDLEKQNRALAQNNKELENFAYVVSHDLQEPLRMIRSYCELLNEKYQNKLDEEGEEFLAFAVDGARRMQRLIGDLLIYSRASRHELSLVEINLEHLIEDVTKNIAKTIAERNAHIIIQGTLPTLSVEPVMLEQVLQNLISNAIKFQNSNTVPEIRISARKENSSWIISVADNGIGFEPQYATKIFEMFQRLHSREKFEGTGIGLAICQRIIERHNGRIWAESVPGQGTTFSFSIPENKNQQKAE